MSQDKVRALIIEDSRQDAEFLGELLKEDKRIDILARAQSVEDGVRLIYDLKPELVFLDIELLGGDAFDLLHRIQHVDPRPAIIFTTGFNDHAIKAIRHAALDYLLKPIDPAELSHAIDRYFQASKYPLSTEQLQKLLHRVDPGQKIKINTYSGFTLVHPDEIIYLEAEGNYTDIHMEEGKVLTTSTNLGKIEELLPSGRFFRIHRSVVINLQYLTSVNRQKKRCYLAVNGNEMEFCIPTKRIRELEGVV